MSPVGTPFAPATGNPAPADTPVDEAPASTEADTKTEKKKAEPRDYKVMTTVSGTVDKVKTELDKLGNEKVHVYIVHGKANALQPKLALQSYGKDRDLDGKYVLAAAGAFKEFTVKSEQETKRRVKIS